MGAVSESRAESLAAAVAAEDLDALLVGDLVNPGDSGPEASADLRWLTGFSGTSGLGLVGAELRAFVTDFRYIERAREELPAGFELLRAERHLSAALTPHLSGRVGYDPTATSVREQQRLLELRPDGAELVESEGLLKRLRRVKDEAEIEAIAAASALTDAVYAELESDGLLGRRERDVAVWIETRMRELGASGPSFPPIVAAGANGSLPHAEPGEHEIAAGELVTVDIGAVLDGYCSDGTRTYAASEPGPQEREVYAVVLEAQTEALGAIRAGESGKAIDSVARDLIVAAGYGKEFGHGLGHGVGLAVHEAPRLSQRSEDDLLVGDVVTVEPGIYLSGRLGVRIEDLVVVERDGRRNLSSRPTELAVLG